MHQEMERVLLHGLVQTRLGVRTQLGVRNPGPPPRSDVHEEDGPCKADDRRKGLDSRNLTSHDLQQWNEKVESKPTSVSETKIISYEQRLSGRWPTPGNLIRCSLQYATVFGIL